MVNLLYVTQRNLIFSILGNIVRPTEGEDIKAFFEIFDTDNDGYFSVEDLVTVIRSFDNKGIIPDLNKMKQKTFDNKKELSDCATSGSSKSITSEESSDEASEEAAIQSVYVTSERVLKLAKRLIKKSGFYTENKLDFEQFRTFINNNQYLSQAIKCGMRTDLWSQDCACRSGSEEDEFLTSICKAIIPSTKSITSSFTEPSVLEKHHEKIYTGSEIELYTDMVDADFQGFLKIKGRKSGAMKKRYYFIKNNVLYYYNKISDDTPKDVTYMPNKLIKKEYIKGKFCISVFTYDSNYHYKTLYAASEQERDAWFDALLIASNNEDITKQYKMKETLGVGKFATVRKAYSIEDPSKTVAIKIISKKSFTDVEREYVLNEINILSLVNHPNIPKVYGIHETPDRLYIVMSNIQGGELFEYLIESSKLPEDEATHIVHKLLRIVKYLSELKIMHRDIKTENMLIEKNRKGLVKKVYLTDFGLAKIIDSREEVTSKLGTLGYCAPEVIVKSPYNEAVDIWGVGITYYLLLTGRLPFDSKSSSELAEMTVKNEMPLEPEVFDGFDSHIPKFLTMACEKKPENRITIDECLNHSLFQF